MGGASCDEEEEDHQEDSCQSPNKSPVIKERVWGLKGVEGGKMVKSRSMTSPYHKPQLTDDVN